MPTPVEDLLAKAKREFALAETKTKLGDKKQALEAVKLTFISLNMELKKQSLSPTVMAEAKSLFSKLEGAYKTINQTERQSAEMITKVQQSNTDEKNKEKSVGIKLLEANKRYKESLDLPIAEKVKKLDDVMATLKSATGDITTFNISGEVVRQAEALSMAVYKELKPLKALAEIEGLIKNSKNEGHVELVFLKLTEFKKMLESMEIKEPNRDMSNITKKFDELVERAESALKSMRAVPSVSANRAAIGESYNRMESKAAKQSGMVVTDQAQKTKDMMSKVSEAREMAERVRAGKATPEDNKVVDNMMADIKRTHGKR